MREEIEKTADMIAGIGAFARNETSLPLPPTEENVTLAEDYGKEASQFLNYCFRALEDEKVASLLIRPGKTRLKLIPLMDQAGFAASIELVKEDNNAPQVCLELETTYSERILQTGTDGLRLLKKKAALCHFSLFSLLEDSYSWECQFEKGEEAPDGIPKRVLASKALKPKDFMRNPHLIPDLIRNLGHYFDKAKGRLLGELADEENLRNFIDTFASANKILAEVFDSEGVAQ